VNCKDPQGLNIFEGGFLGLDNIGVPIGRGRSPGAHRATDGTA
jgi:hypothetical protein